MRRLDDMDERRCDVQEVYYSTKRYSLNSHSHRTLEDEQFR